MQEEKDPGQEALGRCPKIALLTPYDGGNLGDAAIQDSMIANLRRRLPGIQFLGITLNCHNFVARHGGDAFPILASASKANGVENARAELHKTRRKRWERAIRRGLNSAPKLLALLKQTRASAYTGLLELSHSFRAFRVLRKQDLLIVSGGGQLDEEWGGPWRFPFAIFKWVLLARLAQVPCAVASVGACKVTSVVARIFLSTALRLCTYRSYRDANSRAIAATWLSRAAKDSVVPDLVFSVPDSELPSPSGELREIAGGRPVVAISPIAYAKPVNWPTPDTTVHQRYVQELARVISALLEEGYFLVVVYSSLGDDQSVIPDLLARVRKGENGSLEQIYFPTINSWRDLVAVLHDCDYLVASRLHSAILGFVTRTPTVAISFDRKVDWVMQDLQQGAFLFQIRDFVAEQICDAVHRLTMSRGDIETQLASYRRLSLSDSADQYCLLAGLALAHCESRN